MMGKNIVTLFCTRSSNIYKYASNKQFKDSVLANELQLNKTGHSPSISLYQGYVLTRWKSHCMTAQVTSKP